MHERKNESKQERKIESKQERKQERKKEGKKERSASSIPPAARYLYAAWSAAGDALIWARWYKTRATTISLVDGASGAARAVLSYDFSDAYGHPGSPLLEEGQ